MAEPLNILLIQSDQHRFDCLGVNGHRVVGTPNLDALAAEGRNFTHAFCPIPLCMPTRASMLTGQWPTEHMQIANFDTESPRGFRDDLPTFSELLSAAGYRLGYVGKWHGHPERGPEEFGFDTYVPNWRYKPWREEQGLPPIPSEQGWMGETDPHAAPEQSSLAWQADQTIALLEEFAGGDKPFFLRWDPPEPHLPSRPPSEYAEMYPPERIEPWGSFGDTFEGKPYIQAQQLRTWGIEDWSWQQWAPVVGRYLAIITLMDHQIGRVLRHLEELEVAEETLVIYTADHGDMCGSHGMIDKHYIMYDDVVRVPLIARWPGGPAGSCDAFVSNALDLSATFMEAAGLPAPETFRDRSLGAVLRGEADDVGREDIFSTYHGNQFGLFSQRMVRDRRWKYVWNATAEDELYDLEADPWELRNLARDPAHADELTRLRHRLVDWMERTNDRLLNHWTRPQLLENRTL
ncbi:MAG: sulfatase-like hydrolase/transferase [Candidatus Brocadiia bacterium]